MLSIDEFNRRLSSLTSHYLSVSTEYETVKQHQEYRYIVGECLRLQADIAPFDSVVSIAQGAIVCQLSAMAWISHGSHQRAINYIFTLCKIWNSALSLGYVDASNAQIALNHFEFVYEILNKEMSWVCKTSITDLINNEVLKFFCDSSYQFLAFGQTLLKNRSDQYDKWLRYLNKISCPPQSILQVHSDSQPPFEKKRRNGVKLPPIVEENDIHRRPKAAGKVRTVVSKMKEAAVGPLPELSVVGNGSVMFRTGKSFAQEKLPPILRN